MIILYIFIAIAIIRIATNIYRLLATKFYYFLFRNKSRKLNEYNIPVGNLFQKAGTQHLIVATERHSIEMMYKDYISNHLTDRSCYDKLCEIFESTIGVYKFRIRKTFYPIYWITLPVNILETKNIHLNKFVSLLVNIAFWLISFLAGYFLEHYLDTYLPIELFSVLGNSPK